MSAESTSVEDHEQLLSLNTPYIHGVKSRDVRRFDKILADARSARQSREVSTRAKAALSVRLQEMDLHVRGRHGQPAAAPSESRCDG